MLSTQEERAWEDIQRHWSEEAAELTRQARGQGDTPLAVLIGFRLTIVLVFLGAVVPALVVAVATAVTWALSMDRRPEEDR